MVAILLLVVSETVTVKLLEIPLSPFVPEIVLSRDSVDRSVQRTQCIVRSIELVRTGLNTVVV